MNNPPPPPSPGDPPPPPAKTRKKRPEAVISTSTGPGPAGTPGRDPLAHDPTIDAPKAILKSVPAPNGLPADAVRAPFVTNLVISRRSEDFINDRCTEALEEMKSSSGWNMTSDEDKYIYQGNGSDPHRLEVIDRRHFEKRALYRAISENNMKWRRWLYGQENIFAEHNLCANICRRVSMAMAAKGIGYFFGSRPYFTVYPRQKTAEDVTKALQKVGESKMDKSLSSQALRDAIGEAFNLGEAVLKTTFERRMTLSKRKDRVMVDENGAFVMGEDGDYITAGPGDAAQVNADLFQMDAMGQQVLKRDGVTVIQPDYRFTYGLIARRTVHYQGPKIEKLLSRSFFCPLDAKSIQEADYCCHTYEATPVEIASYFTDSTTSAQLVQAIQVMQTIANVKPFGSYDPASPSSAEGTHSAKLEVQEFWIRVDADEDGNTEDICFVRIGPKGGEMTPIFYDYTENVTSTKQRPFHCVRAIARDGRWTGIGAIELFIEHQKIVDLMLNRWALSVSSSGYITVFDPEAFEETCGENPDLTLNNGQTYRLRPGKQLENSIKRVYLENTIGPEWKDIMQMFLQLCINESGVSTANDGAIAGLETTKLATGLRQMDAAGNELYGVYVSSLEQGIESAIEAFTVTLYDRISTREVAIVTENNVPQQFAVEPRDVQGLDLEVSVVLAKFKSEHLIAALTAVLPSIQIYYTLIQTPEGKEGYGNALKQLLMAMNVESPEEIVKMAVIDPNQIPLMQQAFASIDPQAQQILLPAMMAAGIVAQPGAAPQAGAPAPQQALPPSPTVQMPPQSLPQVA